MSSSSGLIRPPPASSSSSVNDEPATTPLTTIFTPPPDCFNPILHVNQGRSYFNIRGVPTLQTPDATITNVLRQDATCYPTPFSFPNGFPLYSPGVCPSGFHIVASQILGLSGATTATYATCCPTDALLGDFGKCYTSQPTAVTITSDDGSFTVYSDKYNIQVQPVTVAWQSSDLSKFHPRSAPIETMSAGSPSTLTKPQSQSTSIPAQTASMNKKALSTGTTAGIGVGVGLCVVAIGVLMAWAVFRHRKRKGQQQKRITLSESRSEGCHNHEKDMAKYEMDGRNVRFELNPYSTRYELPS